MGSLDYDFQAKVWVPQAESGGCWLPLYQVSLVPHLAESATVQVGPDMLALLLQLTSWAVLDGHAEQLITLWAVAQHSVSILQ